MIWIGLTGGIATGKSTVTKILKKMGIAVIDADLLAHQALGPGGPRVDAVVAHFGNHILTSSGVIDRDKLAQIVFANSDERLALESLIHPWIQAEVSRLKGQLVEAGTPFAFYDVPLLFEKALEQNFDQIWVVACSSENQISRLMNRSRLSRDQAQARIAAQLDLKTKTERADVVLLNDSDLFDLEKAVALQVQKLKGLS